MATADTTEAAYEELLERYERISAINGASGVLSWDQQTMMPDDGTPARSAQLSALSGISHDLLTDDEFGDLLDQLEDADLDPEQEAVVRELRFGYDRAVEVPEDLVQELTETSSEAQQIWQNAKAEDEFGEFAPTLETIRDLHVERAEHIDPDKNPYLVMHEGGERDIPIEKVEDIFATLREELVPLIDDIKQNGDDLPSPFAERGPYDPDKQEELSRDALDLLNFDWDRGRLDVSPHPFTSGNQFDTRITTRFREDDFLGSLTATVHEFGHATYQLGLPQEQFGSPLGESRSAGVHESQSRFWENHVGRTREFWELFLPTVKEHFPELDDVDVEEAYAAVNRIYPENLIRVEADELTYHMHIILRYEIGRAFVEGDIGVDEIPQVWNEKMEEYLGVTPDTDTNGCLQDIHWTGGFAAFQGYTIGSVLAAQLDAAMRREIDDVDEKIRTGEFEPLLDWMRENVHSHGQRYRADELIEEATGEPLTAEYFVDYATEKFTDLYGL
jgi:carboxypeptidase Taq